MKSIKSLLLLAALLLAAPVVAQVEIDQKALIGAWTLKKDPMTITLTFKKGGKLEQKIVISAAEMQGSIRTTMKGEWTSAADSICVKVDPESVQAKYIGSNKQIGDMIEQSFTANRDKLMQQAGVTDQVLRQVVIADDILIFSQQIPAIPGMTEAKEERVVMTREK